MKPLTFYLTIFCFLCSPPIMAVASAKIHETKSHPFNAEKTLFYETDGHYWTVLVVATLLKVPEAKAIAYSAEFPDNVINSDGYNVRNRYTFLNPAVQKKVHALTGGIPESEWMISRKMLDNAKTVKDKGVAIHRLGDSFSHVNDKKGKMFPYLIGHLFKWQGPDNIKSNPKKYLHYVRELILGLGGDESLIDMRVFYYVAAGGLGTDDNSAILKAEYNLLNNSVAFNVAEDKLQVVQQYLNQRFSSKSDSYAIHSNTDDRGKITKTIVFTNKRFESTELLPEYINTTEPIFLPVQKRTHEGLYVSLASGAIFGTIKGSDVSGSAVNMQFPGFGFDLQIGGSLRNNMILHGILARKTMVGNGPGNANDKFSIDENVVGIGITHYFKNNLFFTGNIGLGSFSMTEIGTSFLTESGFSYQFKAGKDWRLSEVCSLGASVTYSSTFLTNTWAGGSEDKWSSSLFGFMMNVTFSKGK